MFKRPVSGTERWVAFSILVDESASMGSGDKVATAIKLTILLGETLGRLGIPFEIIGFTTADYEARAAMKLGLSRRTPIERPAAARSNTESTNSLMNLSASPERGSPDYKPGITTGMKSTCSLRCVGCRRATSSVKS